MRPLILKELEQNRFSWEYFLGQLGAGTTLARMIQKSFPLDSGKLLLAIPPEANPEEISDLRASLRHLSLQDGETAFAALVVSFLRDPGRAVLLQHTMASISDEWLQRYSLKNRAMTYKSEVYFYLDGATLDERDISDLSARGSLYPRSAFFFPMVWHGMKKELTDPDMARIAGTLIGVNVGALDDDTFLLWWRNGAERPWHEGEALVL
jgi:hypothetical protein